MSDPASRLQAFLAGVQQLPPYLGPTWRGCTADVEFIRPGQLVVTTAITATSRQLDIATEARTTPAVYAILSRTGRDISQFSAQRADEEVVFLPGTVFLLERTADAAGYPVHVVTEVLPNSEPVRTPDGQVDQFAADAQRWVTEAAGRPAAPFTGPAGKFSGDIN